MIRDAGVGAVRDHGERDDRIAADVATERPIRFNLTVAPSADSPAVLPKPAFSGLSSPRTSGRPT